jgi:hypothetical protein
MTLECQNDLAYGGRVSAGAFRRKASRQLRACLPEAPLAVAPKGGGPAGYLLAWTAALAFCAGLVGLAVSSPFEVAVPRWLILAHGAACVLTALLALWLTRA